MSNLSSITVPAEIWSRLETLAKARKTDVAGLVAEAIGLEEVFVSAQENGSRMLVERNGRVHELVPATH